MNRSRYIPAAEAGVPDHDLKTLDERIFDASPEGRRKILMEQMRRRNTSSSSDDKPLLSLRLGDIMKPMESSHYLESIRPFADFTVSTAIGDVIRRAYEFYSTFCQSEDLRYLASAADLLFPVLAAMENRHVSDERKKDLHIQSARILCNKILRKKHGTDSL